MTSEICQTYFTDLYIHASYNRTTSSGNELLYFWAVYISYVMLHELNIIYIY